MSNKLKVSKCCDECEPKAPRRGIIGTPWCGNMGNCSCHDSELKETTINGFGILWDNGEIWFYPPNKEEDAKRGHDKKVVPVTITYHL